jgi:DNA-directed RNA polymerase specialized sigma24 family protein
LSPREGASCRSPAIDDTDAKDVVQEAYLRAFKFFAGFHGDTGLEANRGAEIPHRAASMWL